MSVFARYGEVLRGTGAAAPFAASLTGRLSLGMTGLALLLLVEHETGSYARAGIVAAAFGLALAAGAPARARSADRAGPVGVLRWTGVAHPAALVVLTGATVAGAPLALLLALAVAAGMTVPPHGAVMRALWGSLIPADKLPTAYSLEAVAVELCFVIGPLLTGVLTAVVGAEWALLTSALAAGTGALLISRTAPVRAAKPHPERVHSLAGPLVSGAVRALLVTVIALGVGFGAVEVAVPAYVEEHGLPTGVTGLLLAVWSVGSMAGGLLYGGLHSSRPHDRQLPLLAGAIAVGTALPLLAPSPWALAGALVLYGSTIAPFSACNSVLLGAAAPPGTVTEAFAWTGSMIFLGVAIGNASAGALVERTGPTGGLAVAAGGGIVLALVSWGGINVVRRGAQAALLQQAADGAEPQR